MRNLSTPSMRALITLALALSACASGGSTATPAADTAGAATPAGQITLRVFNDHQANVDLRIYIVPQAGQRQLLGTVAPRDTLVRAFTGNRGDPYRLFAERLPEVDLNSPEFRPTTGFYTWTLSLNRVQQSSR